MDKALLIETLKLEVVFPAKSKVLNGGKDITLIQSNYRYLGLEQKSLWVWVELFEEQGLSLEETLRSLVKKEIGDNYDIRYDRFSGYLGVTSNTYYELVKN